MFYYIEDYDPFLKIDLNLTNIKRINDVKANT